MMLQKIRSRRAKLLLFTSAMMTITFSSIAMLTQTVREEKTETAAPAKAETPSKEETTTVNRRPPLGEVKLLSNGTMAYIGTESRPIFEGNLRTWMNENRQAAATDGKKGTVLVAFVVDSDGKVISPYIEKSSGNATLDYEALRLFNNMPAWTPGKLNGKNVPVYSTLPVLFTPNGIESAGC